ncbi:MAG: c-type cytochrome [Sphingorhabdus sp.]
MSDSNTIVGWILGAGIAALGSSILFGEVFHVEAHGEKMGYEIQGVESSGEGAADAAVPLPVLLASADMAKGEATFAKCTACHTSNAGGADGVGPNLNGILGKGLASGSFAYSSALKEVGGSWDFEKMDKWIASPKKFATGNKMSFPGIGNAEERANLLLYINSQGSNLPLPAAPAVEEASGEDEAAAEEAE